MFLIGFTKTLNILTFLTFIPHILSMISGAPPGQVIYSLKPSWWNTIHKVYGLARLNRMAIICDSMVGVRHSAVEQVIEREDLFWFQQGTLASCFC